MALGGGPMGPMVARRERGAAILTALLVVTLAAVLVSALFYRMNVPIRSIENRLSLAQTRWVERAALDWAKVILRSDNALFDHPSDVWGTPVVETQLDETVTAGARIGDRSRNAFLAGAVTDAQSRFNVNTLVAPNGQPSTLHMAAMTKLMSLLWLPEQLESALVFAPDPARVRRLARQAGDPGDAAAADEAHRSARHSGLRRRGDAEAAAACDRVTG